MSEQTFSTEAAKLLPLGYRLRAFQTQALVTHDERIRLIIERADEHGWLPLQELNFPAAKRRINTIEAMAQSMVRSFMRNRFPERPIE